MHCEKCNGRRYNRETLEISYKGKSISDVLDMTVDEAVEFFLNVPYLYRKIKVLQEVGLGYITLGQSACNTERWRGADALNSERNYPNVKPEKHFIYSMSRQPVCILKTSATCWMC